MPGSPSTYPRHFFSLDPHLRGALPSTKVQSQTLALSPDPPLPLFLASPLEPSYVPLAFGSALYPHLCLPSPCANRGPQPPFSSRLGHTQPQRHLAPLFKTFWDETAHMGRKGVSWGPVPLTPSQL